MEKVGTVQYQAARAITVVWKVVQAMFNIMQLFPLNSKRYELRWMTLSDRCICRRILQIDKIFNKKTPA